ncbi:MAG: histidine kinase [Planctomycetota bacterium]|nr:MAG: histidine kinase [Planctomycetota bacterium]
MSAESSLLADRGLLAEFVAEAHEGLANVEAQLLAIEGDPAASADAVNGMFRTVHSIKGAAGFLDLKTIELLAHSLEQVLNHVRNGELAPRTDDTSVLLRCIDRLKRLIDDIDGSNAADVTAEREALVAICRRAAGGDSSTAQAEATLPASAMPPGGSTSPSAVEQAAVREFIVECREALDQIDRDLLSWEREPQSADTLDSLFRGLHTVKGSSGFLGFGKLESLAHAGESLLGQLREGAVRDSAHVAETMLELVDATRTIIQEVERTGREGSDSFVRLEQRLRALAAGDAATLRPSETARAAALAGSIAASKPTAEAESRNSAASESTIRVDVGLLDRLMNQVGELVLARNQILQHVSRYADPAFTSTTQRLNLITSELQEGVMKTRMQPIGNVWSKFPRVVRDLALQLNKRVRIEMEGKETELDKTIIEAIKDPLTHLVRNAVDHGLELPETRRQAGKPAEGRLTLRAYHEGGQVNIEIADDGAGLNVPRIRERAVQRGLLTSDQAQRMSDAELSQLIFAPGFSTAEKVTNVSGRGVGMDVVRTNIEKISGAIDIQSQPGLGTTIKIRIPLTLAIIPALMVTGDGDRYAIAQASLLELVRLERDEAAAQLESLNGALVYRLRGRLLPLVSLRTALGGQMQPVADLLAAGDVVNIVVLKSGDHAFGLIVDQINDTEEIVVKPLAKQLKGVAVYAGATILGDGRVALILDVNGLSQCAGVIGSADEAASAGNGQVYSEEAGDAAQSLLVFMVGRRRLAMPMSAVTRLEKIDADRIELSEFGQAVQYRNRILPLHDLGELLGAASERPAGAMRDVIVYGSDAEVAGIIIDEVVDIVETPVCIARRASSGLMQGAVVVQGRLTDLLDTQALSRALRLATGCGFVV